MRFELWLTEGIRVLVLCRDPAELFTALCSADIPVSDARELGPETYSFIVSASAAAKVRALCSRCGADVADVRRLGFRHFLRRFRKRAWLLLIPLPFLLFFILLSTRLWEINVTGNTTISRAEILTALEEVGVYSGVSGLRLDNAQIRSRMQEKLKELIWCTVQVHGSRATVVVRERRSTPEIVNEQLEREVAAARSGTIESIRVLEGKAVAKRGDTVLQGETLISGVLSDLQGGSRRVHALGRVMALTWYEKSMELPLSVSEKLITGSITKFSGLKIGDLRLFFQNDSSICRDNYDKIYDEQRLVFFGLYLPVSILRTEYRSYRLSERELSPEEGASLLKERLLDWLRKTAPDAELLEVQFSVYDSGDRLTVSMLAQCREDIATERAINP